MSIVRVYAYEVYSPMEDAFVPANVDVYAILEVIQADKNLRVVGGDFLDVDESLVNERGRYHRPSPTAPSHRR